MDIQIALWFSSVQQNINEKNDLLGKKFMVFSDHTLLIPLYNHPNKLATHHVDRHRNQLRAYNFDVQFVKGTIGTKRDEGRPRVSQETVQSQIKRDKQGLIWQNMGQTEGVGAI